MAEPMIVTMMTMLSRVLGLARDVIIADKIGAGASADVFFFANRIPNFLRRLFAEGAFSQAFVPVLAEVKEKHGDDEVRQFLAKVSGTLGVILLIVTLIGVLLSPLIVMTFGAGWFLDWVNDGPQGHKFDQASLMLKITFPYLFFVSFVALSGSVLNTYNRFALAAFTPALLNISMIGCAIWLSPHLEEPAYALAIGVFVGGVAQFLLQLPYLFRKKLLVRPKWAWRDPWVVKIRTLMIPALFGVSVSQINLFLDTAIASFLVSSSISWLYFADRLLEFPLGLFAIGIATVILPHLSKLHAQESTEEYQATVEWGMRFIGLFGLPAMVGLIILAKPIIALLYLRGEFTLNDVNQVGFALYAYASGLLGFMMIKVLAPAFYARQDTKTPVKIGIITMVVNMGLNLLFAPLFGYVGLAAASAIAAYVNAGMLYFQLRKQMQFRLSRSTKIFFARLCLSAGGMAGVLLYALEPWNEMQHWTWDAFGKQLLWLIPCGGISYFVVFFVLGGRPRQILHS